jgi:hypothetical protein
MKKETKKYELINDDGCHCDECRATSAKAARKIFAQSWTGDFVIVCRSENEESVNVRLK